MAPRFINFPDWRDKRDYSAQRAYYVYDPAPVTWQNWEFGARIIDTEADYNLKFSRVPALSMDWLKQIHGATMNGLSGSAGQFRQYEEFGLALIRKVALNPRQANGARSLDFETISEPKKKLVEFQTTQCLEDRTPEFQARFSEQMRQGMGFNRHDWPAIDPNEFFTTPDGEKKQCGFLIYAPPHEVIPQMNRWLDDLNSITSTWGGFQPRGDPIYVAARAQRWLIAVHPYVRGNGRVSRFVMEWLIKSIGLPAPILKDMNEDMYRTESEWAQEVGDGILRAIHAAELCAEYPMSKGCTEISLSNEEVLP